MKENAKHKIFIVDDHALFRGGFRGLLEQFGDCSVEGEAADGAEFIAMLGETPADIVMLDIDMPRMNGIEAAERALAMRPDLKSIALSMHGDEYYYFKMVALGVKGFLLKNSDIDEVLAAISAVADGGSYFSQELLQTLVGNMKSASTDDSQEPLSQRELEILPLICKGMSNHEIADTLFISKRTVDKHRANILQKTGCRNTASLVTYAIKKSLVKL
jgi:DNA-binding NarL/FixJ family response regulator